MWTRRQSSEKLLLGKVEDHALVHIKDFRLDYHALPNTLQDVVNYWQALKGQRIAPAWREVDMMRLPLELLPTTVVVDCFHHEDAPNYRYRYYGSGLRTIHKVELTGKTPDDLPYPKLSHFVKSEFREVQESRTPLFASYGVDDGVTLVDPGAFLNVVRLPISDDGETVSHILGVIRYMTHDFQLRKMFSALGEEPDPLESPA